MPRRDHFVAWADAARLKREVDGGCSGAYPYSTRRGYEGCKVRFEAADFIAEDERCAV